MAGYRRGIGLVGAEDMVLGLEDLDSVAMPYLDYSSDTMSI